jgi:DNA-binding XRE family transcriptional regulator
LISVTGEQLVVLTRAEYEALCERAEEAEEDAADVALYDAGKAKMAADPDCILPVEVSANVLRGQGLLQSLRTWRGLTQTQLAERANLSQVTLIELEARRRIGSTETLLALAKALEVNPNWLLPDA